MKKIIFALAAFFVISLASNAQDYSTGIGVRAGLSNGLTVKHFINSSDAIEGLVSSRWSGFNITGLYEFHSRAFNTPRLNWYYGAGGHIGSWKGSRDSDRDNYTFLGIDGIIGIEYNIEAIPFNISLDWKPTLNILGETEFLADELAISFRYIF